MSFDTKSEIIFETANHNVVWTWIVDLEHHKIILKIQEKSIFIRCCVTYRFLDVSLLNNTKPQVEIVRNIKN